MDMTDLSVFRAMPRSWRNTELRKEKEKCCWKWDKDEFWLLLWRAVWKLFVLQDPEAAVHGGTFRKPFNRSQGPIWSAAWPDQLIQRARVVRWIGACICLLHDKYRKKSAQMRQFQGMQTVKGTGYIRINGAEKAGALQAYDHICEGFYPIPKTGIHDFPIREFMWSQNGNSWQLRTGIY